MNTVNLKSEIINKFDVSGPRYTSYPTAPEWSVEVKENTYQDKLTEFSHSNRTVSLYVHIPFCQSMCTFCACNVIIRRHDKKYGDEYLNYLFREMDLVSRWLGTKKKVCQLHFGGGTPNFLNEQQLERLFQKIQEYFDIDFTGEVAIEVDPRTISQTKVRFLRQMGFNRISMGIQDFDLEVQKAVNRIQPFEIVKDLNGWCRDLKFKSVNFDLIYGLPYQTPERFATTIEKVIDLRPDRIALYSFAYVPWLKKHQSKIDPQSLLTNERKLEIFIQARQKFLEAGYEAIAMDHFAVGEDELALAFKEGKLYRNFMGYTVKPADEYIGFGLTSIGFLENTYFQNYRTLPKYYGVLDRNEIPIERGKILTQDDKMRQWVINSLMCQFQVDKNEFQMRFHYNFDKYFQEEQSHLHHCCEDDLILLKPDRISVTDLGKFFIRNICMGFDWYLRQKDAHRQFSKTI